jgi:UDPglucose 6-dehydrogenase
VVVGSDSERALHTLRSLYAPFLRTGKPFMTMSNASAEMVKHASNAMLATRISFINELAALCEEADADVEDVRLGLAADSRIGPQFLFPGLGFGGSCLPKDIRSLAHVGRRHGRRMHITEAAEVINRKARERFLERIAEHFGGDLNGRAIAFWGLAFKPRTDDVREAPALWVIEQMLQRWPEVELRAHDPVANPTAARRLPDSVRFFDDQYGPLAGAQALVVCTDWNEFRSPDFGRIEELLAEPVIFDGRNLYDPAMLMEAGFTYYSVGRPPVRGK